MDSSLVSVSLNRLSRSSARRLCCCCCGTTFAADTFEPDGLLLVSLVRFDRDDDFLICGDCFCIIC